MKLLSHLPTAGLILWQSTGINNSRCLQQAEQSMDCLAGLEEGDQTDDLPDDGNGWNI